MRWRCILDLPRRGAYNMALDEALFRAVEARQSPPTIRVYGWEPACLSLGYFQKPERELDAMRLARDGVDFVVRPTGGRAVLHVEELTYAVMAPADAAPWCATRAEAYERISRALVEGLAATGLELALERGEPGPRAAAPGVAAPCFASTARSEVTWRGRKLVGSAQRRGQGAFLQHGSIPLTPRHREVVEYLRLGPGRGDFLRELDANAVCLGQALGRDTAYGDLAPAFLGRFAAALGGEWGMGGPTPAEARACLAGEAERLRFQAGYLAAGAIHA